MPQDQRYGRRSSRYDWDDERDRGYGRGDESGRSEPRTFRGTYEEERSGRSRYEHDTRQDRDYQGTLRAGDYGRYEEEDDFSPRSSGRDYRESDLGSRRSHPSYSQGGYGSSDYSSGTSKRRGMRNYASDYGDQSRYGSYGGSSTEGYGNYGQGGGYEGGFGSYTRDYDRKYGSGSYGSSGYGRGDYGNRERGWWDRATDEVSSWFGDRDAERRRNMDEHRGRGPKNYTRSDDRIREDVSDRLTDDPLVDASDIDVTVQSQEVTLTGTVSSRNERRLAEETVESVSGVKYVQNNLRVKPRQSWPQGSSGSSSTSGGSSGSSGSGSSDLRSFGSGGTTTM